LVTLMAGLWKSERKRGAEESLSRGSRHRAAGWTARQAAPPISGRVRSGLLDAPADFGHHADMTAFPRFNGIICCGIITG